MSLEIYKSILINLYATRLRHNAILQILCFGWDGLSLQCNFRWLDVVHEMRRLLYGFLLEYGYDEG